MGRSYETRPLSQKPALSVVILDSMAVPSAISIPGSNLGVVDHCWLEDSQDQFTTREDKPILKRPDQETPVCNTLGNRVGFFETQSREGIAPWLVKLVEDAGWEEVRKSY